MKSVIDQGIYLFIYENFNIDNSYPLGKCNVSNSIGIKAGILPNTLVTVLFPFWTLEKENVQGGVCSRGLDKDKARGGHCSMWRSLEVNNVQQGECWRWRRLKENVGRRRRFQPPIR